MVEPDAGSSTDSSGGKSLLHPAKARSITRATTSIAAEARHTVSLSSPPATSSITPLLQPLCASAATADHNFFFTHSGTHVHLFLDECMPTRAHANVCTHVSRQDSNDIYELSPDELDRALLHAVGMLW